MESQRENLAEIRSDIAVGAGLSDREWTEFVASQPSATQSHLIEWREVISAVFGYEPLYRVARRGGKITGVLPAFLVNSLLLGRHILSVPFLNSGGICAADEASRDALIAGIYGLVKSHRARHAELRCTCPPPDGIAARTHKVRIVMDLPETADKLWASFRGEIRNRTRRAQNAGLTVEFDSDRIDGFYSVFAENMRELGVPAHPKRFFTQVLDAFPERSELAVVMAGSDVIGGAILFRFRDTIEVPWISCSRSHFELCPNNILYWEIMKHACEEGARTFDFGRSSPDTGPATFKMRWGARQEQLYWHYIMPGQTAMPAETGVSNPRFSCASDVWKRTPRTLTNLLGPRLIRHLPG